MSDDKVPEQGCPHGQESWYCDACAMEREKNAESATELLKFILRVFAVLSKADSCDDLYWRCDGEYAPVKLFINCNDQFWWATADVEEVTPENVEQLEESLADIRSIKWPEDYKGSSRIYLCTALFCSRARGMRPQGAYYKDMPKELEALFDAAGPEREYIPGEAFGNTPKPTHIP